MQIRPFILGSLATALLGLSVWGCCGITRHLIVTVDKWGDAAPAPGAINQVAAHINLTLDNVNRPCKGPAGPDACGTLAQFNKTLIKAGDAIVSTQELEKTVPPHVIDAMDSIQKAGLSLSGTADSATAVLNTTNQTVTLLNSPVNGLPPMMKAYTDAGNNLNDLLKRKAVEQTLDNLAGITGNLNGITDDTRQVADKLKTDYLTPKPWYRKAGHILMDGFDVAAAVARHTP